MSSCLSMPSMSLSSQIKRRYYASFSENKPRFDVCRDKLYSYEHLASSYPPAPTPFKYINTGSFIGYVGSLKKWLNALQPIDPGGCDQGQTTVHYLKKPKNRSFFTLDHHCRLFLTLYMVDEKDVKIDTKNKIVECLITHSYPCVIHANGQSFQAWNKIYQQLIKK